VRSTGVPAGLDIPSLATGARDLLEGLGKPSGLHFKPAITLYEVIEKFDEPADVTLIDSEHASDKKLPRPPQKFSMLRLTPKTGRTHQLRVHMTSVGHPMVGDHMYGGRTFQKGDFVFARQALHAAEITFVHPVTLASMTIKAPFPADLTRLLAILRGESV